jgi:moderate conductance mechanosensitive channel
MVTYDHERLGAVTTTISVAEWPLLSDARVADRRCGDPLLPLKMQGVDQLGDFAVQLRAKMMTLPGEQFVIRRQAYAIIKKAFDENGIKFASPTVSVTGEGDTSAATAAVAQRALELAKPAAA